MPRRSSSGRPKGKPCSQPSPRPTAATSPTAAFGCREPVKRFGNPPPLDAGTDGLRAGPLVDDPGGARADVHHRLREAPCHARPIASPALHLDDDPIRAAIEHEIYLAARSGPPEKRLRVGMGELLAANEIFDHERLEARPGHGV